MITQEGSLAFDFSSQRSSRAYVQYVHLALVELMALLVPLHRVGMLRSRAQDAYNSAKVNQVMQEFQLDEEETLEFSRQTRAWDQEELDKGMPFQKRINV